ncbi:MAG: response regulator [Bacteroidales bacterium]|nr:response regulator [Bacteroidales bacterium]MBN2699770.1 response regulator [Bacteroidales bacterium]
MSKLIFFVDDDKMILNLLEYTFQSRKSYTVKTFFSGEKCIENLKQNPDLIVLDHILSGSGGGRMNGLETLKEIRRHNAEVPVIILTGHGNDELLSEFMDNGASRFLTKDHFFIDSLIETLDQLLP